MTAGRQIRTALWLTLLCAMEAFAQQYPSKAIRLVVPFPPGASNDIIARLTGQRLSEAFGQPVVIDNRGGAGGAIGAEIVAKSPADGYTLLVSSTSYTTNAAIQVKPAYDPVADIAGVAMIGKAPMLVTVHPAVAATSIRELMAMAKAQPGRINYASSGNGSAVHLMTEVFVSEARIVMTHVPYKGLGPALNDLIGGQVQLLIASLPSVLSHVKANRLRAIAVTSPARSTFAPELATVAESGLPGFATEIWWGVLAPSRIPKGIAERINSEVRRMLATDDMKQRLAFEGAVPSPMQASEFSALVRHEIAKWRKVVKTSGVKAE
ncbi:MAG: tripartite tricarboxylate transporter substrate binding protein [Burkholderiales bacterium]